MNTPEVNQEVYFPGPRNCIRTGKFLHTENNYFVIEFEGRKVMRMPSDVHTNKQSFLLFILRKEYKIKEHLVTELELSDDRIHIYEETLKLIG